MRRWRRQKRRESLAKTNQPKPTSPVRTQIIVLRGIVTYLSFPERRFLTTMSATTTTTKKTIKLHKGHSEKYTPPTPTRPSGKQMVVPIKITTYPSLTDRKLPMNMSATTMTNNNSRKFYKGHSTHIWSPCREAENSIQRDYDRPIHSQNVIPNNFDRDNDDE